MSEEQAQAPMSEPTPQILSEGKSVDTLRAETLERAKEAMRQSMAKNSDTPEGESVGSENIEAKGADDATGEKGSEEKASGESKSEIPERTWEAVNRREKQIREQLKSIKETAARADRAERERDEYRRQLDTISQQVTGNPVAFLRANGIEFEDVARMVMGEPAEDKAPKQVSVEESEAFKRLQSEFEEYKTANKSTQEKELLDRFRGDIRSMISDVSKFPILASHKNGADLVFDQANELANAGEQLPSLDELAERVEYELRASLREFASNSAVLEALGLSNSAEKPAARAQSPQPVGRKPQTLTNNSRGATPAMEAPQVPVTQLSDSERVRRAVQAMRRNAASA